MNHVSTGCPIWIASIVESYCGFIQNIKIYTCFQNKNEGKNDIKNMGTELSSIYIPIHMGHPVVYNVSPRFKFRESKGKCYSIQWCVCTYVHNCSTVVNSRNCQVGKFK